VAGVDTHSGTQLLAASTRLPTCPRLQLRAAEESQPRSKSGCGANAHIDKATFPRENYVSQVARALGQAGEGARLLARSYGAANFAGSRSTGWRRNSGQRVDRMKRPTPERFVFARNEMR
jgi:hypothetical protein